MVGVGIYLLSFSIEDQACHKSLRLQTLVLRGQVVDVDEKAKEGVLMDGHVAVKTVQQVERDHPHFESLKL